MENNIERLTIKEIAPYLPYGLKGNFEVSEVVPEAKYELREKELRLDNVDFFVKYAKPNLYSLNLTSKIIHNGQALTPIIELAKISFPEANWKLKNGKCISIDKGIYTDTKYQFSYCPDIQSFQMIYSGETVGRLTVRNQYQLFQKLAEWHIDFLGLIEKGLAIDKNTLK